MEQLETFIKKKEKQRIVNKSLLLINVFFLMLALMLASIYKVGAKSNTAYDKLSSATKTTTTSTAKFKTAGTQIYLLNLKPINLLTFKL